MSDAELLARLNRWIEQQILVLVDIDLLPIRDRIEDLEAKLAQAVEVLEALIHLAHDCEKELTEDLHHMDFCGESEPLTKARATLAEIKLQSSEFATQKGESHE